MTRASALIPQIAATEPEVAPALPARAQAEPRWSRERMARFLELLSTSHNVAEAARAVGMSRQSAYRLRQRLKGQPFDIAWETAVQSAYDALHQAALDRAINGVEVPVYQRGELIGVRRVFDERLTCFLLSARNRHFLERDWQTEDVFSDWTGQLDALIRKVRRGHGLDEPDDAEDDDGADA